MGHSVTLVGGEPSDPDVTIDVPAGINGWTRTTPPSWAGAIGWTTPAATRDLLVITQTGGSSWLLQRLTTCDGQTVRDNIESTTSARAAREAARAYMATNPVDTEGGR